MGLVKLITLITIYMQAQYRNEVIRSISVLWLPIHDFHLSKTYINFCPFLTFYISDTIHVPDTIHVLYMYAYMGALSAGKLTLISWIKKTFNAFSLNIRAFGLPDFIPKNIDVFFISNYFDLLPNLICNHLPNLLIFDFEALR